MSNKIYTIIFTAEQAALVLATMEAEFRRTRYLPDSNEANVATLDALVKRTKRWELSPEGHKEQQ